MNERVVNTLKKLKDRISQAEKSDSKLSEMDTRQGLINLMFSTLGWDFSDFTAVKSELRHKNYNDPVDYAFFSEKDANKPVLLLEAKTLGTNLNDPKIVKQLCMYLGEMGVQWGVLSDGNKYVMYNSRGGSSFQEQKFMTLTIKDADTEDGMSFDDLAEKFIALLSRSCLENDDIQATYEQHMVDAQIEDALYSLLSAPFDTLANAIKSEFKQDRVKTNDNLKIPKKRIIEFLENLAGEEGQLPINFTDDDQSDKDDLLIKDVANNTLNISSTTQDGSITGQKTKLISIKDLLQDDIIQEGDNWRLQYKGETFWGRITGNGEIEVNGNLFSNPSRAGNHIMNKPCAGWNWWTFKDSNGNWENIELLRAEYREKHGLHKITRKQKEEKSVA